jgi:predicted Zn-dependent protease
MIETRRALAYIGLGMMPQAEYAARQAVAEWNANPNARYWLAITLARQGRASEAETELDRSIARFPADSAATQLRDELRREVSKSR